MAKTYDIRKIEELHKLRADLYEERKHLSPEEYKAHVQALEADEWYE